MWSGATIPTGWVSCDGQNGSPDLRDKFIMSSGPTYAVNTTGGEASKTLSIDEMPNHDHGLTINAAGNHTHAAFVFNGGTGGTGFLPGGLYSGPNEMSSAGSHSHEYSMEKTGGSQPFSLIPPYYALQYIMFTG